MQKETRSQPRLLETDSPFCLQREQVRTVTILLSTAVKLLGSSLEPTAGNQRPAGKQQCRHQLRTSCCMGDDPCLNSCPAFRWLQQEQAASLTRDSACQRDKTYWCSYQVQDGQDRSFETGIETFPVRRLVYPYPKQHSQAYTRGTNTK